MSNGEQLPYMKFFPTDFLADCDVLSVGARGAWHTFLCKAWLARSASVSLKPAQWSRVFGATNAEQAERLIAEIEECEVGDVIRDDSGRVTLISRRIERDLKEMGASSKKKSEAARKAAEARWAKHRQSGGDPPGMRDACEPHTEGNTDAMPSDAIPEARSQKRERERAREAQKVVEAYPRREKTADALGIVLGQLEDGEDFEAMLVGTKACAAVIRTLPSKHLNRFVPSAVSFFRDRRWKDDPETLKRQGSAATGQGQMDLEEAKRQLGGRAAALES